MINQPRAFLYVLLASFPFNGAAQSVTPPPENGRPEIPEIELFTPLAPPDVLGKERPKLSEEEPGPPPSPPEFVLPPVEPVPEGEFQPSQMLRVFVRKIQVTGNTVFSEADLSKITRKYENHEITSEQLQTLRHELSLFYINEGYINSGAVIPDQQITNNGVVRINIIEGRLAGLAVEGNDWLRNGYIRKRIKHGAASPLKVQNLQQSLLLLQQDPLIERIHAELKPGLRPGESQLNVRVKEATPYQIGLGVSNNRSPSIGGESGKIWVTHRNLTGFGDAMYFSYAKTGGLDDFYGSYSVPLNAFDTRLSAYYQNSNSDVVEDPFSERDIRSRSDTFGVSLAHPFYRTQKQTLSMALRFEHRRSKTFLGGKPFPFSVGVPDEGDDEGESKISVIRFSQDWLDRDLTQVLAIRSTFSFGIDVLDPTKNQSDPDGEFFTWLGQFQWIRRLPWLDSQLIFRTDLQISSDPLLPLEKFSVGGMNSVRGYRENQLVRDNGVVASLEWRLPVFRLPIPGLSKSMEDGVVQLAAFADIGWSENIDLPSPDPRTLSSMGLGIRWDPSHKFHSELYWGIPFRKVRENTEYDIQDAGIHFLVSSRLF